MTTAAELAQEQTAQIFPYSVTAEETAKGIRLRVHVYGKDETDTILSMLRMYESAKAKLREHGHTLAPMNTNGGKE